MSSNGTGKKKSTITLTGKTVTQIVVAGVLAVVVAFVGYGVYGSTVTPSNHGQQVETDQSAGSTSGSGQASQDTQATGQPSEQTQQPQQSTATEKKQEASKPTKKELRAAAVKKAKKKGFTVFEGKIRVLNYNQMVKLQGEPDPNAAYGSTQKSYTYTVLVFDSSKKVHAMDGDGQGSSTRSADMLLLGIDNSTWDKYDGKSVVLGVNTKKCTVMWPSDTSLPLGKPRLLESTVSKSSVKVFYAG